MAPPPSSLLTHPWVSRIAAQHWARTAAARGAVPVACRRSVQHDAGPWVLLPPDSARRVPTQRRRFQTPRPVPPAAVPWGGSGVEGDPTPHIPCTAPARRGAMGQGDPPRDIPPPPPHRRTPLVPLPGPRAPADDPPPPAGPTPPPAPQCPQLRPHGQNPPGPRRGAGTDAVAGQGPRRRPQKRLGRRLEEVAKAVGGGYCRLQMLLKPALGVRGTGAGHGLGVLVGGGGGGARSPLSMHRWGGGGGGHPDGSGLLTAPSPCHSARGRAPPPRRSASPGNGLKPDPKIVGGSRRTDRPPPPPPPTQAEGCGGGGGFWWGDGGGARAGQRCHTRPVAAPADAPFPSTWPVVLWTRVPPPPPHTHPKPDPTASSSGGRASAPPENSAAAACRTPRGCRSRPPPPPRAPLQTFPELSRVLGRRASPALRGRRRRVCPGCDGCGVCVERFVQKSCLAPNPKTIIFEIKKMCQRTRAPSWRNLQGRAPPWRCPDGLALTWRQPSGRAPP